MNDENFIILMLGLIIVILSYWLGYAMRIFDDLKERRIKKNG